VLKDRVPVLAGEVVDATFMSRRALCAFLEREVADAKDQGILFSLHMKATMMKVSDPIIFGHAVRTYFAEVFDTHGETLTELGVSPNDGMASCSPPSPTCPTSSARRSRPTSRRHCPAGRRSRWSTPTAASRTSTCRAT
jgi:monomeric type NADP-dependent isocitrate dehydrogenase